MMVGRAEYSVTLWTEEAVTSGIQHHGQARAFLEKDYSGCFEGHSSAQVLLFQNHREGKRILGEGAELRGGYVGQEVFKGSLFGHQGTFVVQHGGYQDGTTPQVFGVIVPGSGTGELAGLSGTFENPHDESHPGVVNFTCALPPAALKESPDNHLHAVPEGSKP